MKVVYANRSDWRFRPGGDSVQMERTAEAITKAFDCEIHFAESPTDPAIATCDLVHIFNTQTLENSLDYAQAAKAVGKPYLVSTIHWDLSHAMFVEFAYGRRHTPRVSGKPLFDLLMAAAARLTGRPRYYSPGRRAQMRGLLRGAAHLLPNSDEELVLMEHYVGEKLGPATAVVNAMDPERFSTFPSPFSDDRAGKGEGLGVRVPGDLGLLPDGTPLRAPSSPALLPETGRRESVLVAARFLPVKNQLGVARALKTLPDVTATMVGGCVDKGYLKDVEAVGVGDRCRILAEDKPQEELVALYQSHRVHVLASFRESPGLSTLEALACGCRVVVASSAYCPVQFYFRELLGKWVFPCDPYDPGDIARAIGEALAADSPYDLVEGVLKRFTWAEAAEQTFGAYLNSVV